MADFDRARFAATYKARTCEAEVCMRGDLIVEHASVEAELAGARKVAADDMFNADVSALTARLKDLEGQIEASTETFVFQALAPKVWQDLIAKHPPTPAQKDKDRGLDHNPETFPQVAIAEASLEPKLTVDDVNWLHSDPDLGLQFTEFQKLWGACLDANLAVTQAPKSALAAVIGSLSQNVASSTTAARKASPAASSSAGSPKTANRSGSKKTATRRSAGRPNKT